MFKYVKIQEGTGRTQDTILWRIGDTISLIEEEQGEMFADTDDFVGSGAEHRYSSYNVASIFS